MCVEVGCCILDVFFLKQKTAYEMRSSDWSSDVCSSDLVGLQAHIRLCRYPARDRIEQPMRLAKAQRRGHAQAVATAGEQQIDGGVERVQSNRGDGHGGEYRLMARKKGTGVEPGGL